MNSSSPEIVMRTGGRRCRALCALLATGAVLGSATQALAQQDAKGAPSAQPTPTWYASVLGAGDTGFLMTHFWSRGPLFRAEAVIAGHRIVTIVNGEYYYMIDELSGSGVRVQRNPKAIADDRTRDRAFGNEFDELIRQGGEKVRTGEIDGRSVDLYRITNSTGRREVWVPTQPPFLPLRVETFHRKSGRTETVEYLNWSRDLYPPDSFFEPAPDTALRYLDYGEYVELSGKQAIGPAPVMFRDLLHGRRD